MSTHFFCHTSPNWNSLDHRSDSSFAAPDLRAIYHRHGVFIPEWPRRNDGLCCTVILNVIASLHCPKRSPDRFKYAQLLRDPNRSFLTLLSRLTSMRSKKPSSRNTRNLWANGSPVSAVATTSDSLCGSPARHTSWARLIIKMKLIWADYVMLCGEYKDSVRC